MNIILNYPVLSNIKLIPYFFILNRNFIEIYNYNNFNLFLFNIKLNYLSFVKNFRLFLYLESKNLLYKRNNTSNFKSRSDVSYSNKKIRVQKGSGKARAGRRSSPIYIGGGIVFGSNKFYRRKILFNKIFKKIVFEFILFYKRHSIIVIDKILFDINYFNFDNCFIFFDILDFKNIFIYKILLSKIIIIFI